MGSYRALLKAASVVLFVVTVASGAAVTTPAKFQPQIPSLASFTTHGSSGSFILSPITRIVVNSKYGSSGSPSALDFAREFHDDLASVTSFSTLPSAQLGSGIFAQGTPLLPVISVVVDPSQEYELFNGKKTVEGYDLVVGEGTLTVRASAPIGAWWGMRTVVQQAALAVASGAKQIAFPLGNGTDSPGWEVRGFMLDAGRHWFDTTFLGEFCLYFLLRAGPLHSRVVHVKETAVG